jgi:ComEC/Rec2-related protein
MTGILLGASVLAGALFGVSGIAVVAIASLVGLRIGWLRAVWAVLFIGLSIGACLRVGHAGAALKPPEWAGTRHSFEGVIENNPAGNGRSQHFIAAIKPVGGGESARACVAAPVAPLVGRGDLVAFTGDVRTIYEVSPSFRAIMERDGCAVSISTRGIERLSRGSGVLAALDRIRQRAVSNLQRLVPGDAGTLAAGLVTGDDAALSAETRDAFYLTGTSHVTAVSGSNLALFVGFFATTGAAVGWMRRLAWQFATISIVWCYVLMIGASAPAIRSGLVATLAIVAVRFGRKPDLLTIALLVAAIQVLIRPHDAGVLSYRLSTAAALGLLLALGQDRPASGWRWLWRVVAATSAANLATAPVLLATVGLPIPVRSVIANLAIAPLIELLFPLSMLAALVSAVWMPAAQSVAPLIELLSRVCLGLVRLCARIPGPTVRTETALIGEEVWLALVVALFCIASREVRGGIARLARRWGTVTPADGFVAIVLIVLAGVSALVAWLRR